MFSTMNIHNLGECKFWHLAFLLLPWAEWCHGWWTCHSTVRAAAENALWSTPSNLL